MFIYTRCQCSRKPKEYKFSDKQLTSFEERLKLVAVKARIQILLLLADSPHCVCDIVAHTEFSQSLVSHHLADLMDACLIGSKKEGKYVEYFLRNSGRELLKAIEHVNMCCEIGKTEGGEEQMKQDKNGCKCDDETNKCCDGDEKGCCGVEAKVEEMSKEDLLEEKSKLEESLKKVNEVLTKAK
jgi:ArsR family transcriptional regulator